PTVTVTSSTTPSTYGTSVTFTATLTPSPGSAGTITFKDGATTLCLNVAVTAGAATCATSSLGAGSHTITATFNGSPGFNTRRRTRAETINPEATNDTADN